MLLRGKQPIALCPARSLEAMRIPAPRGGGALASL